MRELNFVSLFIPTKENINGPSALPYFIMKDRPLEVNINIFSYNHNNISFNEIRKVEEELNVTITVLKLPIWYTLMRKHKLGKLRLLFRKPLQAYIKLPNSLIRKFNSNLNTTLWMYPHCFYLSSKKMPLVKKVVTGPDSIALHYYRVLKDRIVLSKKWQLLAYTELYKKHVKQEYDWNIPNTTMHFVGLADYNFFKRINPNTEAFFLLHPHYLFLDKEIGFNEPKLKILISGKKDIYTQSDSEELLRVLCKQNDLQSKVSITFLGKGWEDYVLKLQQKGYESNCLTWVDSFAEEIIKYDIKIIPISVGTGTKGKVLDAMSNGLLCIGSSYSFENICVRNNESCLAYSNVAEVPIILNKVYNNRKKYEIIASNGRDQVMKYHSSERISARFFELIK